MRGRKKLSTLGIVLIAASLILVAIFGYQMYTGVNIPYLLFMTASLPMILGLCMIFVRKQKRKVIENVDSKICPQCHHTINHRFHRCPYCGADLSRQKVQKVTKELLGIAGAFYFTDDDHCIPGNIVIQKKDKRVYISFINIDGSIINENEINHCGSISITIQDGASKLVYLNDFYYLTNDNIEQFVDYLTNHHSQITSISFAGQ